MIRTQIYLTEQEKSGVESEARRRGIRQSEVIRQAIDNLLSRRETDRRIRAINQVAGLWKTRDDLPSIPALRSGWKMRHSHE